MVIYVDGLLILNFYLDFLLLLTTSVILKRNVSVFRLLLGSFIGSFSILILFFKIGLIEILFIKFYLGFLMCIICFGYKNIKYFLASMGMFYLLCIVLGGFVFFIKINFKDFTSCLYIIFLCIFSPIILYLYSRQVKNYKMIISHFHKVDIYLLDMVLKLNGYLDTGNRLLFKGRMVIITNIDIDFDLEKYYIPCVSLGGVSLIESVLVDKVVVDDIEFKDVYLGFSKNMNIYGMDVLLNGRMG